MVCYPFNRCDKCIIDMKSRITLEFNREDRTINYYLAQSAIFQLKKRLHLDHPEELDIDISMQNAIIRKKYALRCIALVVLLIFNGNNIGPRTDPCGTPEVTSTRLQWTPLTTVVWVWSERKQTTKCLIFNTIVVKFGYEKFVWCFVKCFTEVKIHCPLDPCYLKCLSSHWWYLLAV